MFCIKQNKLLIYAKQYVSFHLMTFDAYLTKNNLRNVDVAQTLSITPQYVGQIRRGEKTAGPKLIKRIDEWSGGAVQFDDWYPNEVEDAA